MTPEEILKEIKQIQSNSKYEALKESLIPFQYKKGEKIVDLDLFFRSSIKYLTHNASNIKSDLPNPYIERIRLVLTQLKNKV